MVAERYELVRASTERIANRFGGFSEVSTIWIKNVRSDLELALKHTELSKKEPAGVFGGPAFGESSAWVDYDRRGASIIPGALTAAKSFTPRRWRDHQTISRRFHLGFIGFPYGVGTVGVMSIFRMGPCLKVLRGLVFASLLIVLGVFVAGSWVLSGYVVSPPRRQIAAWQQERMGQASAQGVKVTRFRASDGTPALICEPAGRPSERGSILRKQLAKRGEKLDPYGEAIGTLVLLHGRGMRKEDLLMCAERFCAAGFRCVLIDLPAHGENPAPLTRLATSRSERQMPGRVVREAAEQFGFVPKPCAIWGISLGGAYALGAASEEPEFWSSVVVVGTFDRIGPIVDREADRLFGVASPLIQLGVEGCLRVRGGYGIGQVGPAAYASTMKVPTMVVHGADDELIPVSQGRRLYEALPAGHKRWVEVPGGGHGNVLATPMELYAEMAIWMRRAPLADAASYGIASTTTNPGTSRK